MKSRDFAYWLQGFFELSGKTEITPEQAVIIKNHLNMVFIHEIDPSMGPVSHQVDLSAAHAGKPQPSLFTGQTVLDSAIPRC